MLHDTEVWCTDAKVCCTMQRYGAQMKKPERRLVALSEQVRISHTTPTPINAQHHVDNNAKRVHFSKTSELQFVERNDEAGAVWYSEQEYRAMKVANVKAVLKAQKAQQKLSHQKTQNFPIGGQIF